MEFCEFLAKHPDRAQNLDKAPDELLRHAIRRFTEESGRLWVLLADYYSRLGLFGRARDVFEEALAQLTSVRDFGLIFNAYLKFEEAMLDHENQEDESEDEQEDSEEGDDLADQVDMLLNFTYRDIDEQDGDEGTEKDDPVKLTKEEKQGLKFYRLENLIMRRPFLLSNVVLRQNPNNVYEWVSRIELCKDDSYLAVKTFTEAIQTIDPQKASGKASRVWVRFGQFYEEHGELHNANLVYHKASQLSFKSIEELSLIYCSWAEMHIRHNNIPSAIEIMKHACNKPYRKGKHPKATEKDAGGSLSNNIRAWSLYIDLLENFSTFEDTKWAYERLLDLKIATPETVLNFASFLQRNNFFEESYRVFERAVQIFKWPHLYEIWVTYLTKII